MIMAGRGRRLGDAANSVKKVGMSTPINTTTQHQPPIDIENLNKNISEINLEIMDLTILKSIETLFKNLCPTQAALKNVVSSLYSKALCDKNFIEKLIIAVFNVLHLEVEESSVKREFLTIMQEEYELRDSIFGSNKPRLYNAIEILGYFYHLSNIQKSSYWFLGKALVDYFELLIKGSKDDIKLFTKEIVLNHNILSKTSKISQIYTLLQHNLRNMILSTIKDEESKCWILLALEVMIGESGTLNIPAKDFYMKNLKNDLMELETFIVKVSKLDAKYNNSAKTSEEGVKKDNKTEDLTVKFIDINLSSLPAAKENDKKSKTSIQMNKNKKKENQNLRGNKKFYPNKKDGLFKSEHDDRFDKDESYYQIKSSGPLKSDIS